MFLEKIREFAENLPDSLEELNLRMIEVTDELVESITHIDFTDSGACQDLVKVLKILEFFLFRGERERPEISELSDAKLRVFHSINIRLYRLSVQKSTLCSGIENYLSTTSLLTLCLLYMIDGVLDDKCHEKLQNVLRSECLNAKTCPFVTWCFLAISRLTSSNYQYNTLPAWIPKSANPESISENFCDYDRIFDMLSQIIWRCSISGTPAFNSFLLIIRDTANLEKWEISESVVKKLFMMDLLADVLMGPMFPMRHIDKLTQLAGLVLEKNPEELENPNLDYQKSKFLYANRMEVSSLLDLSQYLEMYQNCENFGKQYHIAVAYFDRLEAQIYSANEISMNEKTIESMLLAVVDNVKAKQFYSIFHECQVQLSLEVRIKYCGKEAVAFTENQKLELLSEIVQDLESFNDSKHMLDILTALEVLLLNLRHTQNNLEVVKTKINEFASNHQNKVNELLKRDDVFPLFSRTGLLSVIEPHTLDIYTKRNYLDKMRGKEHENFLWSFLHDYLCHLPSSYSNELERKLCKYFLEIERDDKCQKRFVEKSQGLVNMHIRKLISQVSPLLPLFLAIPKLLSFELKCDMIKSMRTIDQYAFLEECFIEFEKVLANHNVLRAIEYVSGCLLAAYEKENIKTVSGRRLKATADKYNQVIDKILRLNEDKNFRYLRTLFFIACPKALSLHQRLSILQEKLQIRGLSSGFISLTIDRQNPLHSSYQAAFEISDLNWRKLFRITFANEPGVDMGGLLREWFTITTREILNPNFGLFIPTPGDVNRYMINISSYVNEDHLKLYEFIGRFVAKGILENVHLDFPLSKVFYKHILGIPTNYTDLESQDPEFFKSLRFILNNSIADSGLDLTFSTEMEHFGAFEEMELIENGKNIHVTDENKHEYVRSVSEMKMIGLIRQQLDAFLDGFYKVISKDLIKLFDENELEMLLCGRSDIDIEDLKASTTYKDYQESDDVIQWFWQALRSFDKKDTTRFLNFATGSPKAPLTGFAHLQGSNGIQLFNVCEDLTAGDDRLPTVQTCFNRLDLPRYNSYEILREKLLLAIREGYEGFGMA